MIIALGLLAVLQGQAPDTTTGLSPVAREMLSRIPVPQNGGVSVGVQLSSGAAWIGEQVDMVTAAWFPRSLRDRLRRQPMLRTPPVAGLWTSPGTGSPILAESRRVGSEVYDLFVSHHILFPLTAGEVVVPPATLSYAVPASNSFFAPEDRTTLESRSTRLVVRPIPASLASRLGSGPTARGITMRWRTPNRAATAGAPIAVELSVTGTGNVTLWPVPELDWGDGVRVYTEPTTERLGRVAGRITGEKLFRYTLVPDSSGVITLPRVRYPYFDPELVQVRIASAEPLAVAVRPAAAAAGRAVVAASRSRAESLASVLVRRWWPLLLVIALLPLVGLAVARRPRRVVRVAVPEPPLDAAFRRLVGADSAGSHRKVVSELRRRGVDRADAEAVGRWLEAVDRHKWGAATGSPPDPGVAARVKAALERNRGVMATLVLALACLAAPAAAQWDEALSRFADGDAAGAERLFASELRSTPAAAGAWLNLGASRWLAGDDVGSVAAWLQGLRVAPRDQRLSSALDVVPMMPRELQRLRPTVPLSRDELVLIGLAAWLLAAVLWRRKRRLAAVAGSLMVLAWGTAALRTWSDGRDRAILRAGTVLRVSPIPAAPTVTEPPAWTTALIERRERGWSLVRLPDGARGWASDIQVAALSRLD